MTPAPILIVDDNVMNLKLAGRILLDEGYDVRTAVDAEEALELLKSFHPRLILMDIQLPGMDGLALSRHLKSDPRTQDIIIVAFTAYAMKGDEEKARDSGCSGYITKPLNTRTFATVVATQLEAASAGGRGHTTP